MSYKMPLELVIGPMFAGKSTTAIWHARRQQAIGRKVCVVKPDIDTRYSDKNVISTHDNVQIPCITWDTEEPLIGSLFLKYDCIVFEEAQFFRNLKNTVMWLIRQDKDILVVGLDGDANQMPFGEVLDCVPFATLVTKLCAFCSVCRDGSYAPFTKRKNPENMTSQICVGGPEMYEAVCWKHLNHQ
jgi:thymidine kinase